MRECPRPERVLQRRSLGKRRSHTRSCGQRAVAMVGSGYGCQLARGSGRLSLPKHVIIFQALKKPTMLRDFPRRLEFPETM